MGLNRNGFQCAVNAQPAPAEAGDFAGTNPRASVQAGPGALVAAVGGLRVGRFAWANPATGKLSNVYQTGSQLCFVHREQQGIITEFLGKATELVVQGYPADGNTRGDFWAEFLLGATAGQKVYANALTGAATAAAAATSGAFAITASLAATGILTVTVTAGVLAVGQVITGAGVPPGLYISAQLSGSAGSTGTYQLAAAFADYVSGTFPVVGSEVMAATTRVETNWTVEQTVPVVAAFTADISVDGIMTVSAISAGALEPGQYMTGVSAAVADNIRIVNQLTGTTGDTGTYTVNRLEEIASQTFTAHAGQVAKISTWN
jgi:hypothetical protein